MSPLRISVERAPQTARFRGIGQAERGEVTDAVRARPVHVHDQWMAVAHVLDVRVLGPVEFIGGDSDPLLDEHPLRDTRRVGVPEDFPDLLLDRLDFIFAGALASRHTRAPVFIEDIERHRRESMIGVECTLPDVSRGDSQDRYAGRLRYLSFEA